jgi:NAD(P)-dependent dehydrogenase (short-subunit alcohol dehydrogenase family)
MKDFQSKVAVITGAASGIGRALAEKCVLEGMKVVLADVEEQALSRTVDELRNLGGEVRSVMTDVSSAESVEALAEDAFTSYGAVHLLFNNAGVGAGSTVWESSLADWKWVLGVNLWGVIHGVHYFVPRMLAQNEQCHIVNTASSAGLIASTDIGIYKVSKHGVVTLSETLALELSERKANIKVSVLCPEWVNTRITEAERNRPESLQNASTDSPPSAETQAVMQAIARVVKAGISPAQVADTVFEAVRQEKFYIFTHPTTKVAVQVRMDDILNERQPRNIMRLE